MKNFSMITDKPNFVTLSPAYDLLSTRLLISEEDDSEELTLSVQGKKSALKRTHFVFLGENLKIPAVTLERTLEFFIDNEQVLGGAISHSFLTDSLKIQYETMISSRISRLR